MSLWLKVELICPFCTKRWVMDKKIYEQEDNTISESCPKCSAYVTLTSYGRGFDIRDTQVVSLSMWWDAPLNLEEAEETWEVEFSNGL